MDDVLFTSDEKTVLITKGVTTCIAFIVQGSFWDEENDKIHFCGLYHWSGFKNVNRTQDQQAKDTLLNFFKKLRNYAGIDDEDEITIDVLYFIGGEKEQCDSDDEILVSGTEAEVNSLQKAVKGFNFAAHQFKIAPENIHHQHFLTEGEQSISIQLTLDAIDCKIKSPAPGDAFDNEVTPNLGMQ